MNIVQLCPHYMPAFNFGGPLRVAHNLGRSLVNLGHDVCVCTTNLKSETEDLDVGVDIPINQDGVVVYYEKTVLSRYWGFSPSLYKRSYTLIKSADIVFVHFHYQFASLIGSYLSRYLHKPYILFPHGSFNKFGVTSNGYWKKHMYLNLLERKNINGAMFLAFNAIEEQELSLFSELGIVVPSGVYPTDFDIKISSESWQSTNNLPENKIYILYLGRLNPTQKGLDFLLPAFARLHQQYNAVHLILAGPDERGGETKIREMVNSLGIKEHVTITGMVEGAEKLAILRDSDIYALVSPSEGLSIAMLEAMYMGLPVVATNRIGLSSEIQQCRAGMVVEREVEQIATALLHMAVDTELRKQMGQNAHKLVSEKYIWPVIAKELINTIQERI